MLLATALAPPFIAQTVALVVAAAAVAYVCHRLGLVPIVGFLAAGVLIGPHALGARRTIWSSSTPRRRSASSSCSSRSGSSSASERLRTHQGADLRRWRAAGRPRHLRDHGGAAAVRRRLARRESSPGSSSSLSSTAIVLKLLADRGETSAAYGQVSLGLLIFQDLAVVVMVLVVPMLGGAGGSTAAIALRPRQGRWPSSSLVLVVARRLMPPLLERVALTLLAGAVPADGHRDLPRHGLAHERRRRQPVARRLPRGPARQRESVQPPRVRRDPAAADPLQRRVLRLGGHAARRRRFSIAAPAARDRCRGLGVRV